MKSLLLLLSLGAVFCFSAALAVDPPGTPKGGLWHLDATKANYVLNLNLATNEDAPYWRAGNPLAIRGRNAAFKINANARSGEGGVTALSAFGGPPQGGRVTNHPGMYAFGQWQYVDQVVAWGGAASSGIILAPLPAVIDAGHRSGVPVLGNIFLPPVVYGGNIAWVNSMVQKSGSTYPVADKLIEIANYCGFDGWFINQETAGANTALATEVANFMKYFKAHSSLKIMWYDAMTESGSVGWQNTLNSSNDAFFQSGATRVSDTFFADFGWSSGNVTGGASTATGLGRNPYEVYFGIDVESGGGTNTSVNWLNLFPAASVHRASLGIYRPDWAYNTAGGSNTTFNNQERRFWSGPNQDPSNPPNTASTTDWEGIANYVQEWTPLQQLPFVTNFNTGHGNRFLQKGVLVRATTDAAGVVFNWNDLSTQDVLPSWQWVVDTTSATPLVPDWDWTDAYTGGNCLRVAGTLDAVNDLKLYQANLPVTATSTLRLVYKDGDANAATNLKVTLAFTDAPTTFVLLDVGARPGTGWSTKTFDLAAYAGRTVGSIGLKFDPTATGTVSGYAMQVGELAIYNGTPAVPAAPTGVVIEHIYGVSPTRYSMRVRWTPSTSTDVRYYNVYRRNADTSRTWLWAASRDACFLPEVDRAGLEAMTTIEVEAINNAKEASPAASASFIWNAPPSMGVIADLGLPVNASTVVPLWVNDIETAPAAITLTATSSNTALIANASLVFGGSGTNRTLTVVPVANQLGSTTITVTADDGNYTASRTFVVVVNTGVELLAEGSTWSYLDTGADPGADWVLNDFGDSAWLTGQGVLGYGDLNGLAPATLVNASTSRITTYFRTHFNVPAPRLYRDFTLRLLRDDGAVVWLNGAEVKRSNMPDAPAVITASTQALVGIPTADENVYFDSPLDANALLPGSNVLAVEVHQFGTTSSDLGFDLALLGTPDVPTLLIPAGALWKYRDTGVAPATSWNTPAFSDATWSTGAARLGYGDTQATLLGYGGNDNARYITSWFRHTFSVADASAFTALRLEFQRDDGVVIYLNGVEVVRDNLPAGIISTSTLATAGISGTDETAWISYTIPATGLVTGANTLAIELHQAAANSSDLGLDVRLSGLQLAATTFTEWQAAHFGSDKLNASVVGPQVDAEKDGLVNLLEYTFASDPRRPSSAVLPTPENVANHLALNFTCTALATDLTLTVQAADTLTGPWTDLAQSTSGYPFVAIAPGTTIQETSTGSTRTLQVGDPVLLNDPAHPHRFLRLQVTTP